MKLLPDQNLSARLLPTLEGRYPGSTHVRELGLGRADDQHIWDLAIEREFVIVSKDTDFYQRSVFFGHPPKVIWLAVGNCTTDAISALLDSAGSAIEEFVADEERSFLVLP